MDQNNQPIPDAAAVKEIPKKPSRTAPATTSATNSPVHYVAEAKEIKLDKIRIDGGTQSRVAIDQLAVDDYAEAMTNGAKLPPATVFFDGTEYWLADGFHRFHAHRKIGALNIDADLREGTQKDAMLFSYGANKDHGLRRSTADKQKSIRGMLADFGDWSDSKIGRHVGVDHKTVAVQRAAILGISQDAGSTRMVERNGKAYLQEISKIGKTVGNAPLGSPSNDAAKTKGVPEPETTRVIPVPVENAEIAEVDTLTEATIDVSNIYDELLKEKERNLVLQNENEHLKKRITDLENELQTTQRSGGVTACNNESLNSVDSNGAD